MSDAHHMHPLNRKKTQASRKGKERKERKAFPYLLTIIFLHIVVMNHNVSAFFFLSFASTLSCLVFSLLIPSSLSSQLNFEKLLYMTRNNVDDDFISFKR